MERWIQAWAVIVVGSINVGASSGCQDAPSSSQPMVAPARPRRTPAPTGVVRALPPHAIRADGVGPYQLGQSLAAQLAELPSGPRLTLLDIPGVVHSNIMRAESGSILVSGGTTGLTEFVAVVAAEVARTESGLAVGAAMPLVQKEMPFAQDRNHARDVRLKQVKDQAAVKLVFDAARILRAFAVSPSSNLGRATIPVVVSACELTARSAGTSGTPKSASMGATNAEDQGGANQRTLGSGADHGANQRTLGSGAAEKVAKAILGEQGACLASGEMIQWSSDELLVRSSEPGRLALSQKIRGLQWAAPLSNGEHDDIAAIARTDSAADKTWSLSLWRFEQGRLQKLSEQAVYRVTAENARWIGAELADVDILMEIAVAEDGVVTSGLLTTTSNKQMRNIVPILSVRVARRNVKNADPSDVKAQSSDTGGL